MIPSNLPIPERLQGRPLDSRGFLIPWFATVTGADGAIDLRVVDPRRREEAFRFSKCWVCGGKLGQHKSFVLGPMCALNRITAEPPMHRECAIYSAQACPFLSRPKQKRNAADMPEGCCPETGNLPGLAIMRNPGAVLVWTSLSYKRVRVPNGYLVQVGEPLETLWFCEGRAATRAEVEHSIDTGLPNLMAAAVTEGPEAVFELNKMREHVSSLLPAV